MKLFFRLALLSLMIFASATAQAHRSQLSVTNMEWVTADRVEITHRIHVHDAQEAMVQSDQGRNGMDITSLEAQARFAIYTEERFNVMDINTGASLSIETIGAEMDGDYLYVYQEIKSAPQRKDIQLSSYILRDVFAGYGNHINLMSDGTVVTLTFQGDDDVKSVPN